jgi:arginase
MNDIEVDQLERHALAFPVALIEGSVRPLAEQALSALEARTRAFALHFDVDVIRFTDFPIANVPIHNEGLSFDQAMECIEVFAASPSCVGMVITEINPDHATEELGRRFSAGVARALQSRISESVTGRTN